MIRSIRPFCVVVFTVVVGAGSGAAQTRGSGAAPTFELWGGFSTMMAPPSATIATSYSPPLLLDGEFVSHAGQTLTVSRESSIGFSAGVNVFPSKHAGLQILVDRVSGTVSGDNAPYAYALQYISRPPPSGLPVSVTADGSIPWPNTAGSLAQLTIAVNGAARIGRPDRVSVTVSAGPAFYRTTGEIEPIGFSTFQLGGHSVLFANEYRLRVSPEAAVAVGLNAGAEVSAALAPHVAVTAGYRLFAGREQTVGVTPTAVINADEVTTAQPLEDIAARMSGSQMRTGSSRSHLFVGLKISR
jgi:hypothetical protein